jgi:hypothetical protein
MRKRFIQCPKTLKLIPAEEWYDSHEPDAPYVMGDIQPYRSMQTGEMITSRSHHKAHLKQHGLVEIGNEVNYHLKQTRQPEPDRAGIRRDLIESMKRKNFL